MKAKVSWVAFLFELNRPFGNWMTYILQLCSQKSPLPITESSKHPRDGLGDQEAEQGQEVKGFLAETRSLSSLAGPGREWGPALPHPRTPQRFLQGPSTVDDGQERRDRRPDHEIFRGASQAGRSCAGLMTQFRVCETLEETSESKLLLPWCPGFVLMSS